MIKSGLLPSPKFLYSQDRPREKLLNNGVESLDEIELITAIIGSGSRQRNVSEIAFDVQNLIAETPGDLSVNKLREVKGLSLAKAARLVASFELVRRQTNLLHQQIRLPQDVWPYVSDIAQAKQEHLVCLSLNGAGELIRKHQITVGTLDSTLVHPREVFAPALTDRAASIILVHNHPSGDVTPSEHDLKATKILQDAGYLLGIPLLDHLIISSTGKMFSIVNPAETT